MRTLLILIVSMISIQAGAEKRGLIARCSNGEETRVSVFDAGDGKARASVTYQSTGDSYPTVEYRNLKISVAKTPGGPVVYHSPKFLFSVKHSGSKISGNLSIPELGIKAEKLKCINVR